MPRFSAIETFVVRIFVALEGPVALLLTDLAVGFLSGLVLLNASLKGFISATSRLVCGYIGTIPINTVHQHDSIESNSVFLLDKSYKGI
jgi:hypothetical protein